MIYPAILPREVGSYREIYLICEQIFIKAVLILNKNFSRITLTLQSTTVQWPIIGLYTSLYVGLLPTNTLPQHSTIGLFQPCLSIRPFCYKLNFYIVHHNFVLFTHRPPLHCNYSRPVAALRMFCDQCD